MSAPDDLERIHICPYCGTERQEHYLSCCGEAGTHGQWVWVNSDGEIVREE